MLLFIRKLKKNVICTYLYMNNKKQLTLLLFNVLVRLSMFVFHVFRMNFPKFIENTLTSHVRLSP